MRASETFTRFARSLPAPSPTRDLVFIDALVVLAAIAVAFAARAAVDSAFALSWSGIAPYVRAGVPLCVAAMLISAAGNGLYGPEAERAGLLRHAAAVAYAGAVVAFADTYWGASPLMLALLPGVLVAIAGIHLARRAYWQRWLPLAATAA